MPSPALDDSARNRRLGNIPILRKSIFVWRQEWEIVWNPPIASYTHPSFMVITSYLTHLPSRRKALQLQGKKDWPKSIVCKKTQIDGPTKPRMWIPVVFRHFLLEEPIPGRASEPCSFQRWNPGLLRSTVTGLFGWCSTWWLLNKIGPLTRRCIPVVAHTSCIPSSSHQPSRSMSACTLAHVSWRTMLPMIQLIDYINAPPMLEGKSRAI